MVSFTEFFNFGFWGLSLVYLFFSCPILSMLITLLAIKKKAENFIFILVSSFVASIVNMIFPIFLLVFNALISGWGSVTLNDVLFTSILIIVWTLYFLLIPQIITFLIAKYVSKKKNVRIVLSIVLPIVLIIIHVIIGAMLGITPD